MIKKYLDYLKDNPQGYWFKAKLFGWGWVPAKWQGWACILIYAAAISCFVFTINDDTSTFNVMVGFILPIIVLTVALIIICYKTGEKPHWQWGLPDKYKRK